MDSRAIISASAQVVIGPDLSAFDEEEKQTSKTRTLQEVPSTLHASRRETTISTEFEMWSSTPFNPPFRYTNTLLFWTAQQESFYCTLDTCSSEAQPGYDTNTQVSGFHPIPIPKPNNTKWIALSSAGAGLIVVLTVAILWYIGRSHNGGDFGKISLPKNEASKLMTDHVPASLHFSNISYFLGNRIILDKISGAVKPGQVMTIMGASSAGKSTFLDILARKHKMGQVSGKTLVNGREVVDAEFEKVMMSLETKKYRTLETMNELGILGIKDSRIGDSGCWSISRGEKRHVSITCKLVTSPSILFLDEPTSRLDSYNAFNVVESLVTLAHDCNRTVIFTIHQPRSNIVALFDHIVLLAHGKMPCPLGFNIADYLIDLTVHAGLEPRNLDSPSNNAVSSTSGDNLLHEERAVGASSVQSRGRSSTAVEEETELRTRGVSFTSSIKCKTSEFLEAVRSSPSGNSTLTPKLAQRVEAYPTSEVAQSIKAETEEVATAQHGVDASHADGELRDVVVENSYCGIGKEPLTIYPLSYWLVSHHLFFDGIAGFQNRLGLFFTLSLFGFSCLSSLALFANERVLFMHERANSYYSTFTYFSSKVLFDILPLRLVPPIAFGGIVYGLVGAYSSGFLEVYIDTRAIQFDNSKCDPSIVDSIYQYRRGELSWHLGHAFQPLHRPPDQQGHCHTCFAVVAYCLILPHCFRVAGMSVLQRTTLRRDSPKRRGRYAQATDATTINSRFTVSKEPNHGVKYDEVVKSREG
ncbi:uncharacterized protein F5147DRAFT_818412 [Suillus discolor]|uniref:ABC transporter domain-containing protein n=1 Tax=Suillus discolor TaxID=1912936 RepID=A0A9P7EXJ5_9AGAM|nr:uncharacterized protein F5147DRAFT_818412 [Suillus discolor]KAG2096312.1 hypothetical protein F5147DRAFT_818412 [Suillus discolor]